MSKRPQLNLFDLHPQRIVDAEPGADGNLTLRVPRFYNKLLVRFLVPRLKSPYVHLRLDAIGSFVWQQCDGRTSLQQIAERAHAQFGDEPEAMAARVAGFVTGLLRQRLLRVTKAG